MKYKITKLDRRHNGHLQFKFIVTPDVIGRNEVVKEFIELRNWCWENFGPSSEREWANPGATWAWESTFGNRRIYLKGEAESTFFALKFVG